MCDNNYNTNLFNLNPNYLKTQSFEVNSNSDLDFPVFNFESTIESPTQNLDLLSKALEDFDFSTKIETKTTKTIENPYNSMNASEIKQAQSALVKITEKYNTNQEPFDITQQNQALALDILTKNLDSIKEQYQNQQDEDGIIREGFNLLKELTNIGVDAKEVESAIKIQEEFLSELKNALNNTSNLSFSEVWEKYTNQEFSSDKVIEYQNCANSYGVLYSGLQKANQFEESLIKASSLEEVFSLYKDFYQDETTAREELVEYLNEGFLIGEDSFSTIKSIEINDKNELIIVNADDYIAFNDEKDLNFTTQVYDLKNAPNLLIQMPGFDKNKYSDEFEQKFEETTGKNKEEIVNDYQKARKSLYGSADSVQNLVDKYCASQEGFASKLSGVLQVGGLCLVAAGAATSLVLPPAGLVMMNVGKYTALTGMLSDNAIELVDNLSSKNGLSKQEAFNLTKDTIKELLLYFSGKGINKAAQGVKNLVLSETQSQVLALLSEIGTDATLSIITDLVLIGEVNFEGEAINQLLGILTGVAGAKVNSYYQQNYQIANNKIKNNDIKGALDSLKQAGFSEKQIKSYIDNFSNREYSNSYELLKLGVDKQFCSKIAQLDDESYKQALELINKGIPESKAAIALSEETTKNRVNDILDNHPKISKYYAADVAGLDSKNYAQVLEFVENEGYSTLDALKAVNEGEKMYDYICAIDDGYIVNKEITNEIESKLLSMTRELETEYRSYDYIEKTMNELFNNDESYIFSYRQKGIDSTLAKLKKAYESGKINLNDINSAKNILQDAHGTRLQINSIDKTYASSIIKESTNNKVDYETLCSVLNDCIKNNIDLSQVGQEYISALDALKEVQNKEVFETLYSAIKNNEIEVTTLHNYGNEISSYFTNRQLVDLAEVYAQAHNNQEFLKLNTYDNLKQYKEVNLEDVYNYKEGEEVDFLSNYDPKNKNKATKKSGYTSCQMNILYKPETGQSSYGEFQIRGKQVSFFGDIEHIPYDIYSGKITAADKQYSDIYSTIKSMSNEGYKTYNQYLNQTYQYLRLKELGLDIAKPELTGPIETIDGGYLDKESLKKIDFEGLSKYKH